MHLKKNHTLFPHPARKILIRFWMVEFEFPFESKQQPHTEKKCHLTGEHHITAWIIFYMMKLLDFSVLVTRRPHYCHTYTNTHNITLYHYYLFSEENEMKKKVNMSKGMMNSIEWIRNSHTVLYTNISIWKTI